MRRRRRTQAGLAGDPGLSRGRYAVGPARPRTGGRQRHHASFGGVRRGVPGLHARAGILAAAFGRHALGRTRRGRRPGAGDDRGGGRGRDRRVRYRAGGGSRHRRRSGDVLDRDHHFAADRAIGEQSYSWPSRRRHLPVPGSELSLATRLGVGAGGRRRASRSFAPDRRHRLCRVGVAAGAGGGALAAAPAVPRHRGGSIYGAIFSRGAARGAGIGLGDPRGRIVAGARRLSCRNDARGNRIPPSSRSDHPLVPRGADRPVFHLHRHVARCPAVAAHSAVGYGDSRRNAAAQGRDGHRGGATRHRELVQIPAHGRRGGARRRVRICAADAVAPARTLEPCPGSTSAGGHCAEHGGVADPDPPQSAHHPRDIGRVRSADFGGDARNPGDIWRSRSGSTW